MTGLALKLGPKERILINGAVLENGSRRSRFSIVTPSAKVLRLKDAIHPDAAHTPLGRICFQLQLILAGNRNATEGTPDIAVQISQLANILMDPLCQEHLATANQAVLQGKFYNALKALKVLLPLETELLSRRLV